MPRTEVDRDELESAIEIIEDDGPLRNLNALYNAVSESFGGSPSPATIKTRIESWNIQIKTQPGRKTKSVLHRLSKSANSLNLNAVTTPAGACPIKLKGTDFNTVKDWAHDVRKHGEMEGVFYLPQALAYFSRQFYDILSNEYLTVKHHIDTIR